MNEPNITYTACRKGFERFLVCAEWMQCTIWVYVKTKKEGLPDTLEARFERPVDDWKVPVPFASLPPISRAMVRALAGAALWEMCLRRKVN